MGRYGRILIVAACCLWMGCASSIKLSSMVIDRGSDEPIGGAVVKLVDPSDAILDSVMTDSSGMFQFTLKDLNKKEEYWLVVNKPLLSEPYREPIQFDRKPPIAAQIRLPLMAGIMGMVKSEDGGAIMGAMVEVVVEEDVLDQMETGTNGSFSIGTLEPGDYKLRIKHFNHYPTQTDYFELKPGSVLRLEAERALKIKRIKGDASQTFRERLDSDNWEIIKITPQEIGRLR